MSFFPGSFFASPSVNNTSFHPLFRLLDDFEQHSRNTGTGTDGHHSRSVMKSFTPKFDVKELADAYELHGELPGIEQKDVEIEFTDAQTISVRGRTERSYTSGTPPSGFIEGSGSQAAIEGSEHSNKSAAHKATVEDEEGATNNNTEVATTNNNKDVAKEEPKAKYWVSERSVGEFSRSFTFPVRVDQEGVKASMKNGVLSITVPKAKKPESRKIAITAN
ncbi:HSP20-like chaperone [Cadophora sp. MPI-SDFR-AT-0126]|nr:HSP20-like chaperone [Leotiomycetes sp. MPI-SDFR-AT-0126]